MMHLFSLRRKSNFIFVLGLVSFNTFAQPTGGQWIANPNGKAANCAPPTITTYMELNNVRTMVHTAGNLWQIPGQNNSLYEVPKNSGIMALFTAALWLGGTDVNGQLKLAALRYRQGQDYWTGPLTNITAEITPDECLKYDKHFVSRQDEVAEFDAWYTAGIEDAVNGTSLQSDMFPNYKVPDFIKDWPAHGDISLGQDPYLAPFFDRDDDGVYEVEKGDYPWFDIHKTKNCHTDRRVSLYGDINFWWVMNDKGNIHTETNSEPIGMEIRAQAFAFSSNDEINNMTFYNYELINRGTQTLYDTYFGFFTDGALGDPNDDYVGCDVNRGLAYYYNGNNIDNDNAGYLGYGASPPAVGVDFFEGPYQDNDGIDNAFGIGPNEALNGIGYGDDVIDNERFGMRRFLYYSNTTNGANPNQTDPINATDYYNYLRGFWKDGTPFVYGGSGHNSDPDADASTPCEFMFPGDTDPLGWGTNGIPQDPWTEQTAGNVPNDRRFLQSAGPFVLRPGAVNNITVGVVWARSKGVDPFESVEKLRLADDKAQALFENCFKVLEGPHAPELTIQELENELILIISNPLGSNNYKEEYEEFDPFISYEDPTADKFYRFQGYQIYQLENDHVSVSELNDPTKARLVVQCDIEDGIDKVVNYEFDELIGGNVPELKVDGKNEGIQHTFKVSTDGFAMGDNRLVNHKKYYFMAISYATNNYKQFDQNDPESLDGQKKMYINSRKAPKGEVKLITAIPHNPTPESGGTNQLADYGFIPEITRLDGTGNGGLELELTDNTVAQILSNGFVQTPVYKANNGPINIKVVDPLNVAKGYFECVFEDYSTSSTNGADTASWTINRYDYEGGSLLDSKSSLFNISYNNEEVIPDWGISVQIRQRLYSGGNSYKYTEPLSARIMFSDSSKRWLSGISDEDGYYPTNWIRSGSANDTGTVADPSWSASACYKDELNVDPEKKYTKLLEGTIAPHRLTGYQCDYMPLAYYNSGSSSPGTPRNTASISYLPSVDIVFTADQSKWTRCPVVELCRDINLAVGNAKQGELRKSLNVGKNGLPDGSVNSDGSTTGMGWFPGYAIDIESGARLFLAFGENSFLGAENGADMIWNPTDRIMDNTSSPLFGGQHSIWVFSYKQKAINDLSTGYDFSSYSESSFELFDLFKDVQSGNSTSKRSLYSSLTWIANPVLAPGRDLLETDTKISLRVSKEYKNYVATNRNGGKPMYSWNMDQNGTVVSSLDQLKSALDLINVVPNPYYAFSDYERNRLDTRVKITNLPEKCVVKVYSIKGKLIREFKKDSPITSIDWDLNNHKGIGVAGGVYLIYVDVPGVGEKIVKFFCSMRQTDLYGI
jgi:hypothetical protein